MELLLPELKVPALRLPSYVKLDMAFGVGAGTSLFDKSRYRAHGAISGADWADGAHGRCLDFVAASKDYVEIAAAYTQLNFTPEDFSIIQRVKFDVVDEYQWLLCRGLDSVDGYEFYIASSNRIQFRTNQSGGSQTTITGVGDITVGTWFTLGVSRSGTSVIIYKNGVALGQTPASHTNPAISTRTAKIGIYDDKNYFALDGKVEFCRIFGGIALPASTHLAFHNALK